MFWFWDWSKFFFGGWARKNLSETWEKVRKSWGGGGVQGRKGDVDGEKYLFSSPSRYSSYSPARPRLQKLQILLPGGGFGACPQRSASWRARNHRAKEPTGLGLACCGRLVANDSPGYLWSKLSEYLANKRNLTNDWMRRVSQPRGRSGIPNEGGKVWVFPSDIIPR